jgi:hypothetical protein
MKSSEGNETKIRKPYIKPQLRVVSLVPKQTVLGACYTASDAHPLTGDFCDFSASCYSSSL